MNLIDGLAKSKKVLNNDPSRDTLLREDLKALVSRNARVV
jgi:hypothetical protein